MKQEYGLTFSPCNGEGIETTGTINVVVMMDGVDKYGCYNYKVHTNTQGVKGVGVETGDTYNIIQISSFNVDDVSVCNGCTVELMINTSWKVIARDGENWTLGGPAKLVINICDGTFTVKFDQILGGCK